MSQEWSLVTHSSDKPTHESTPKSGVWNGLTDGPGCVPIPNYRRPRQLPSQVATRATCPPTMGTRGRKKWILLLEEEGTDAGEAEATEAHDLGQLQRGHTLVWDWEAVLDPPLPQQACLAPSACAAAWLHQTYRLLELCGR